MIARIVALYSALLSTLSTLWSTKAAPCLLSALRWTVCKSYAAWVIFMTTAVIVGFLAHLLDFVRALWRDLADYGGVWAGFSYSNWIKTAESARKRGIV